MISGTALLGLLFQLVIVGLIFYTLWWGLGKIAPPEPINKIVQVILILILVVFLVNLLLGMSGTPLFRWNH